MMSFDLLILRGRQFGVIPAEAPKAESRNP
jgi:hypothetical protein